MARKRAVELACVGFVTVLVLIGVGCAQAGGPWKAVTVYKGHLAKHTSLAVVNGCPAVSFISNQSLMYVRATSADGSSWGHPITIETANAGTLAEHLTLAVVSGKPAISYYGKHGIDEHGRAKRFIKYVRALDADGSCWGIPMPLDVAGFGSRAPMAIVNGNPAIVYEGVALTPWNMFGTGKPAEREGALKYIWAKDADGSFWGKPITLREDDSRAGFMIEGREASLEVVNGIPAICYYNPCGEGIPGEIKFVRALDAHGSSWEYPVTVASTEDIGGWPSFAVINGYPAISYYSSHLRYVRATDADGTSWGNPVKVAAGLYNSLSEISGRPAISYWMDGGLNYIRAADAEGTSWESPISVPTKGVACWHTSLTAVNGRAALSYNCVWKASNGYAVYFAILNEE